MPFQFVPILNALTVTSLFLILSSSAASSTRFRGYTPDNQRNALDIAGDDPPKLTDCLLSAVSGDDCGRVVAGCIWCKEPVYGLCLTESAAERVRWMPFFKCTFPKEKLEEEEFAVDGEVEIA